MMNCENTQAGLPGLPGDVVFVGVHVMESLLSRDGSVAHINRSKTGFFKEIGLEVVQWEKNLEMR